MSDDYRRSVVCLIQSSIRRDSSITGMALTFSSFVHQRGTANGIYVIMVNIGAFLSPVAAGYSAESQGWRW